DGCLVRRPHGRHHAKENRGASEATSRGVECAKRNATEKSCPKLCKGDVLPLDRSLLMGDFPILRHRCLGVGEPQWGTAALDGRQRRYRLLLLPCSAIVASALACRHASWALRRR